MFIHNSTSQLMSHSHNLLFLQYFTNYVLATKCERHDRKLCNLVLHASHMDSCCVFTLNILMRVTTFMVDPWTSTNDNSRSEMYELLLWQPWSNGQEGLLVQIPDQTWSPVEVPLGLVPNSNLPLGHTNCVLPIALDNVCCSVCV